MIIRYLAIVILLLSSGMLFSQDAIKSYKDRVFLSDGSVLIGEVISYNPGESISLEIKNGSILQFSGKQIKRVRMYSGDDFNPGSNIKPGRIYNETQLSFLMGESGVGLSVAHNIFWQYNQQLAIGGGAGIDNYYAAVARDIYPIFVNVKYYIQNMPSSIFIGGKGGYGMAFRNEEEDLFSAKGGMMWNPYVGLRISSQGIIINMFTGLKFQKASYEFIRPWETRAEEIYFRRIEVGASVMF